MGIVLNRADLMGASYLLRQQILSSLNASLIMKLAFRMATTLSKLFSYLT